MGDFEAVVETTGDGTIGEAGPVVLEVRNRHTGQWNRASVDEFTGGHLLHLAVAGCVSNDLFREAKARGIVLTRVRVVADGGFGGDPCQSTGVDYRIEVESNASEPALRDLVARVEDVAEIPSALRHGVLVRLTGARIRSGHEPRPSEVSDPGPFFHGTRADLVGGDVLVPGYASNFGERREANHVYVSATLDAATWGAELAVGEGRGRVYEVEPTGPIEDDPNLTNMRFPGNPTRSYRTRHPVRVVREVLDWEPHPPEVLQTMREHLAALDRQGVEAVDDRVDGDGDGDGDG
ncbi:rifampin ADP-ribosyl transferase [Knoellia aerolata DSM 18566]|uniref:Rifampin ADP-ribosyl transferase n=1 Tax=Knoellia aerolata DSM 18566 TaxID=1385519 RepID=A0A0A0JY57_9MICO|nr:rifampin ADP-ribosyl transferase [Knoellia aerolata DSM 18566]